MQAAWGGWGERDGVFLFSEFSFLLGVFYRRGSVKKDHSPYHQQTPQSLSLLLLPSSQLGDSWYILNHLLMNVTYYALLLRTAGLEFAGWEFLEMKQILYLEGELLYNYYWEESELVFEKVAI